MLPKTVRCLRILAPGSGVLLLGLLVACGGTADLSRAEAHLNGGRLEQAAALLQGSTGARARPLQQRLKTASEERAAAREELDAFLADLGGLDRAEVISGLREMSQRQDDPVVIGWIETEMSRADDLLADRDSTKRRETIDFDAARRERASERKRREEVQPAVGGQLSSDPVLDALLQDARRAAAASDWARALSILDMSLEELPFYRARLDDLERELVDLARLDADEVLAEAGRIEVSGGVQAALDYVDEQRTRFPDIPALEAFYEELDLIGVRSDIAVRLDAADPGVPEEAHEFDDLDDEALLARAREHELRGDYFEASRAWALLDSRGGTEHAEVQSLALVLRAKMAAEIHQAFGRDPAAFDGLVEEVAETGPTTVSGSLSWANTPLPLLIELIDSAEARLRVQVLTYDATGYGGGYFDRLESALRRAAARGVRVELLVADWCKRKGCVDGLQSLASLEGIDVRFAVIPEASTGFVEFSRVAHAKLCVADERAAWIGSSNWEGSYFTTSRNAGLLLEGDAVGQRLADWFDTSWASEYSETVVPGKAYEPRRR